jgi:hypothetical protein
MFYEIIPENCGTDENSENQKLLATYQNPPPYSFSDYGKVRVAIEDCISELKHLAPAMNKAELNEIKALLGIGFGSPDKEQSSFTIDQVEEQYNLVLAIRNKVLSDEGGILEVTSAKDLAALVNSINNLISLFLRQQGKIDQQKEIAKVRTAVTYAIKELPIEQQRKFLDRLNTLKD